MKRRFLLPVCLLAIAAALCSPVEVQTVRAAGTSCKPMYRLYNPNTGEHFYTGNLTERNNVIRAGWHDEGIGWYAPVSGDPVYRLYNPVAGDHHYTMNASERNHLVSVGWKYEGVGWYSDQNHSVPLYRQYNANAKTGCHNYTTSKSENDHLCSIGWRGEGTAWYGVCTQTTHHTECDHSGTHHSETHHCDD
ncbi:MAG: hypothetical protein ACOYBC_08535 [Bilifractor sp.]|jgi:hypothetical protein